ncbi:kinase-like domain-containing protein [Chaetomium sp. MPI-SDFR-AT-0129]|nr:kinase-like domain-containing protein [Chaetomium sp. MPI-SDFR-AT-0129]
MGYFDEYHLDSRFKSTRTGYHPGDPRYHYHVVMDWDQRRTITVGTSEEKDEDFVFEALNEHIDDLPEDVVCIIVSNDFELLSSFTDSALDRTLIPYYPEPLDFPAHLPTIRRSQLTEIDRLGVQTDRVIYEPAPGETKQAVFKYYINEGNTAMVWHEINCTSGIPSHPNIVSFDRLVVDSAGPGFPDKVVGFTTPFIPGGTIKDDINRVFKLQHLRQLLTVIDYLNLRLGIVHGDICTWNLLIDPETDELKVFDFNLASKLGWEGDKKNHGTFGYEEERNDVKLAAFTLYEIITQDLSFREEHYQEDLDISMVLQKEEWVRHPDVHLEEGVEVSEYRRVLEDWVQTRRSVDAQLKDYKQAPEFIDWPSSPPRFPVLDDEEWAMFAGRYRMRQMLIKRGEPFIKWVRPPSTDLPLPEGQRLLATGEIVG